MKRGNLYITITNILLLALASLIVSSCALSPTYQLATMSEFDKSDQPPEAREGWVDGCRSAVAHMTRPSIARYNSPFYINPELVSSPIYKSAWTSANYYCMSKYQYSLSKGVMQKTNLFGQRGDYIVIK